jgi:Tfp pilus assembly protein PilE
VKIAPLTRLGIPLSGITRTGDTADGYRVVSVRRLAHARGPLSLLELALVTVVIGIAAAVAVPEYLHLRQGASDDAAKSRLTQATRILEQRHAAAGTYSGATLPEGVRLQAAGRGSFCVQTTAGDNVWHAAGAHGKPASGACP